MFSFHIFFISIIQGITEFLPISSSAHLIILPYLIKVQDLRGSLQEMMKVCLIYSGCLITIELVSLVKLGLERMDDGTAKSTINNIHIHS